MDKRLYPSRKPNAEIHNFGGSKERYEPKGFQQNDQPARFMGGGR